jgi:phenylacetate-CoA ligase
MAKITGRSDDMIILRGVNVFPSQIEEQVLATGGLAPYYQIELFKAGHMDAMRIHVESSADAKENLSKSASARMLSKRIKDIVGISTEIIVGDTGDVERSQGKARRVVDNRDKE